MARSSVPLRLALASLVCAALVAAPIPPVAKAVGALPLVLYLPGRCWLAAVFPQRKTDGETRVLSAALSLALVTLLGLLLDRVTTLGSAAWLAGLPPLCLVACVIAAFTARGTQTGMQATARVPLGSARLLSLLAAAGLAGFAYVQASDGAWRQHSDRYTDFWVVPESGQAPSIATAGVKNQEGRDTTYAIDVVARGMNVERLNAFRLRPGEMRTIEVALPRVVFAEALTPQSINQDDRPRTVALRTPDDRVGATRVELRLFKDGDRSAAYRRVWVALPAPVESKRVAADAGLSAGDLSYSDSAVDRLRASLRFGAVTASEPSSLAPAPGKRSSPVGDTTHRLDLSQAAALKVSNQDAGAQNLGVAPDDAMTGLRSTRFASGPAAADAVSSNSPE